MSRRRRSGTSLLEDAEEIVELQERQFAEFRRRHVRQNKEVISDNITRIRLVRQLQDQITQLQGELLAVRQQNRDLQRRMVQMHTETCRARGEATIDALDSIISAVPALQHLRTLLASCPIPDVPEPIHEPYMHNFVNPTATRPAATAAVHMGLDPLREALDEPSPEPRRRRPSVSPAKSPRRLLQFTASSPSPSPKRSPQVRKKKRRESGLLLPTRPMSPDSDSEYEDASPVQSPLPSDVNGSSSPDPVPEQESVQETGELDEETDAVEASITECNGVSGKAQESKAADVEATIKEHGKDVTNLNGVKEKENRPPKVKVIPAVFEKVAADAAEDKAASPTSPVSAPPSASSAAPSVTARTAPITIKRVPVPAIHIDEDRASTVSPAPISPLPSESEEQPEPEGRPRRARGSVVSYKEPSLVKKMRKPDGAAVDDLLGLRNREPAVTGVRRKSALPRSTARSATTSDGEKIVKEKTEKEVLRTSTGSASTSTSTSASSTKTERDRSRRVSPPKALSEIDNSNANAPSGIPAPRKATTGTSTGAAAAGSAAERRRRSAAV